MARPDIAMTAAEVDEFLAHCGVMVLGAVDADGWPVGTLARTTFEAGALSVEIDPDDPIVADIERDPRVCCVADEHPSYDAIRGVIVHGRAAARVSGRVAVDVDRVVSFDFGRIGRPPR